MVFLDKPHIKQFTDIFDTSIKNIFIFKIYFYYYLVSVYNLSIHYLTYNYENIYNIFSSWWFFTINIFISIFSFIIIYQNYHIYPTNTISNTVFSLTSSNTIITFLTHLYSHSFILGFELIANIILLSIVIYAFTYRSENFNVSRCIYILFPIYLVVIFFIEYFEIVTTRQLGYLLIFSIGFLFLHSQNIKIIIKRYMQTDFYLAYLNLYFIFIDTINIILLDIIIEIFFPKRKYKK